MFGLGLFYSGFGLEFSVRTRIRVRVKDTGRVRVGFRLRCKLRFELASEFGLGLG